MTDIRPIADNDRTMFYPVTHFQAVKDFNAGVTNAVTAGPEDFFKLLKPGIETWHNGLITKAIKLKSPNGTDFLVSVSDDGKIVVTKEDASNGNTISD